MPVPAFTLPTPSQDEDIEDIIGAAPPRINKRVNKTVSLASSNQGSHVNLSSKKNSPDKSSANKKPKKKPSTPKKSPTITNTNPATSNPTQKKVSPTTSQTNSQISSQASPKKTQEQEIKKKPGFFVRALSWFYAGKKKCDNSIFGRMLRGAKRALDTVFGVGGLVFNPFTKINELATAFVRSSMSWSAKESTRELLERKGLIPKTKEDFEKLRKERIAIINQKIDTYHAMPQSQAKMKLENEILHLQKAPLGNQFLMSLPNTLSAIPYGIPFVSDITKGAINIFLQKVLGLLNNDEMKALAGKDILAQRNVAMRVCKRIFPDSDDALINKAFGAIRIDAKSHAQTAVDLYYAQKSIFLKVSPVYTQVSNVWAIVRNTSNLLARCYELSEHAQAQENVKQLDTMGKLLHSIEIIRHCVDTTLKISDVAKFYYTKAMVKSAASIEREKIEDTKAIKWLKAGLWILERLAETFVGIVDLGLQNKQEIQNQINESIEQAKYMEQQFA